MTGLPVSLKKTGRPFSHERTQGGREPLTRA